MFGGGWSDHIVTRAQKEANTLISMDRSARRKAERELGKLAQENLFAEQCIVHRTTPTSNAINGRRGNAMETASETLQPTMGAIDDQ